MITQSVYAHQRVGQNSRRRILTHAVGRGERSHPADAAPPCGGLRFANPPYALATKADSADVRRDLREVELRLETKMEGVKAEILNWMFGAMAAQTGLIVALIKLLPAAG